ncbi:MAG: hypothetical protein WBX15_10655, partial [Thermoanaerobaculia bacterium]
LVAGGMAVTRRLRMTAKVLDELRRRKFAFDLVVFGDLPEALRGSAGRREILPELDASELANAITSSSLILETVDADEAPSPLAFVARDVGVALAIHQSHPLATVASAIGVTEWSADGFVDAIIAPLPDLTRVPPALDPFVAISELLIGSGPSR